MNTKKTQNPSSLSLHSVIHYSKQYGKVPPGNFPSEGTNHSKQTDLESVAREREGGKKKHP